MQLETRPETGKMHITSEKSILKQAELASGAGGTVRTADDVAREVRVRARDVSVFYGAKQALFDVSIDIPARRSRLSSGRRAAASRHSCAVSTA